MKERPIIFIPELAQKVFDGVKTQTRWIVKFNASGRVELKGRQWHRDDPDAVKACPYGLVGDRCYIREAHYVERQDLILYKGADRNAPVAKWIRSIHMPRWACRTVVELTEVRVERLNRITEEDAIAEGCSQPVGVGPVISKSGARMPRALTVLLWVVLVSIIYWLRGPCC